MADPFQWHFVAAMTARPRATFDLFVLEARFPGPNGISPDAAAWLEAQTADCIAAGLLKRHGAENLPAKHLPHDKSLRRPQPRRGRVEKWAEGDSVQRHFVVKQPCPSNGTSVPATTPLPMLSTADRHLESLPLAYV